MLTAESIPTLPTRSSACSGASLPADWDADLPVFAADAKGLATRDSSGKVLNAIALALPMADRRLGRSRAVDQDAAHIRGRRRSRSRHAGRPQSAFRHSRARHGRDPERARSCPRSAPSASTFLIFSDYMKPPIRLSALMELPVIYVFTHDSIGVGRGRPNAPAGRAARRAAHHSRPHHATACRRQRGRRSMARHYRAEASAGLPGVEPPAAADLRPHALRVGRRCRARRLCPGRCQKTASRR